MCSTRAGAGAQQLHGLIKKSWRSAKNLGCFLFPFLLCFFFLFFWCCCCYLVTLEHLIIKNSQSATCNSSSMNPYHQMIHDSFVIQKTFPDDHLPDFLLSLFPKTPDTQCGGLETLIPSGTRHLLLVIRNSIPFTDRRCSPNENWRFESFEWLSHSSPRVWSLIWDGKMIRFIVGEKMERTVNAQRGNFALLLPQGCNSC